IPRRRVPERLPTVLSTAEVERLLAAAHSPKHRAILMTAYGTGLRVSEILALQTTGAFSRPRTSTSSSPCRPRSGDWCCTTPDAPPGLPHRPPASGASSTSPPPALSPPRPRRRTPTTAPLGAPARPSPSACVPQDPHTAHPTPRPAAKRLSSTGRSANALAP